MSANASQSTDESTDTEIVRHERVQMLAGELDSIRHIRQANNRNYALTPLNDEAGRARVGGVVTNTKDHEGSATASADIVSTAGETVTVYANTYSDVTPSEVTTIEPPQPVIVTVVPDTFSPDNDKNNRTYSSPQLETLRPTTMDEVHAEQAEAANRTRELAPEAQDIDGENLVEQSYQAHYQGSSYNGLTPEELHENAVEALFKALINVTDRTIGEAYDEIHSDASLEELLQSLNHQPAIENLTEEFDSFGELIDAGDLSEIPQVGSSTVGTLNEMINEEAPIESL